MLQANSDASPWGAHIQDIDENSEYGSGDWAYPNWGASYFWIRWSAFVEQWVLKFRTHVFGGMIICHYRPIGLSFPMPSFKLGTSPQPWQPSLPVWGKLCRPMDLSLSCKWRLAVGPVDKSRLVEGEDWKGKPWNHHALHYIYHLVI